MRNRIFLALCALILVNQLGFGLITPVLPAYASTFGVGSGAVGLVIGVYGAARFMANIPAGFIAERHGRKAALIAGTALTSIASALIATADNLPQLLIYRLLAGLGAATVLTAGQVMVGDIATTENRGRMMSMYQGFFLIGVGLGPTPGGILADAFGLRAPFVAYALFSAIACGLALLIITETRPARPTMAMNIREQAAAGPSIRSAALSLPFLLIGCVSFVQFFARTGALFLVVPLLGKDRIGLSATQIGVAMTLVNVLNIATLYHSGALADRHGRRKVIVPATLVSGLSVALFALSGSYAAFLLAALVWGLGSGLSGPAPAAYVADLAPSEQRGRIFGIYRSISDSGYIIGPLLLGWMADAGGFTLPLMLTACMFLLSGALFALFAPETRTTERTVPARPSGDASVTVEPATEPKLT